MGLDMFLSKRVHVGAQYEHRKVTGSINISINEKPLPVNFNKVDYIIENAGYWRKANAIHNWFVNNVQDGNDDCKEYYVDSEQLEELLNICKKVSQNSKLIPGKVSNGYSYDNNNNRIELFEDGLIIEDDSVAKELLPATEGFFFGSTNYDEWYLNDIEHTIEILEAALEDTHNDFYYGSSW